MPTLQVNFSDETARRLETIARKQGLSAEDLVRQVAEEIVRSPDKEFDEVARRVLAKNRELYRRLAT